MIKGLLIDLLFGTILASILTLLSYIIGFDKTWSDAANTYGTCFVIYIAISTYSRIKNKNKTS